MLLVRVFASLAKPALAGSAVIAAAAGGYFALDHLQGSDLTPFQRVQSAGPRLLVSEFGLTEDTIVALDPEDPGARTEIATIDHAEAYGVFATLSPDGQAIAYTALPVDSAEPGPGAPAIAGIVEADGDVAALADDVDLLVPPVWAPDGESIVVRKNTPADDAAGRFELVLLGRDGTRSTITEWSSAAVFPIAFSPDGGRLYFATLNAAGTDLYAVAPDGSSETKVAHLSDEIARDWKLSPDGGQLAYTVAESGPQPRMRTAVLDLASGAVEELDADALSPAWDRDGSVTVSRLGTDGGGETVDIGADETRTLAADGARIDLPLAWSPDGSTLVVRAVERTRAGDAGASHVDLLSADGSRRRASDSPDALVVGWLE